MYGNQTIIPQPKEESLFKTLITEMAKSGKYEEAFKMLVVAFEDMEERVKNLEKK